MSLDTLLAVLGVLLAAIVVPLAAGQLYFTAYPLWESYRRRKVLLKELSLGSFDTATIERATRYYIQPKVSNIDPSREDEIRHALVAVRDDAFSLLDKFLQSNNCRRHLLVLADSGMGKTSLLLNFYAWNRNRAKRKRLPIALVHLGVEGADNLIAKFPDPRESVLFLDALDEDVRAVEDHHARLGQLLKLASAFSKVVVTCRTQFFPRDEEIPVDTGLIMPGPQPAGTTGAYELWKLYLAPFDDNEVRAYLRKRFPFRRRSQRSKAEEIARKIPLLSVRPMLLAHIPELLKRDTRNLSVGMLYEIMIDDWLERERRWANKVALREFSELLAVDLYTRREERGMERVPSTDLPQLAREWKIELHPWQLSGRSLLNRDALGNYKFAHRSIMEYLVTQRLRSGDTRCAEVLLTDMMKHFLVEHLRPRGGKSNLRRVFEGRKVVGRVMRTNTISTKGELRYLPWHRLFSAADRLLERTPAEYRHPSSKWLLSTSPVNQEVVQNEASVFLKNAEITLETLGPDGLAAQVSPLVRAWPRPFASDFRAEILFGIFSGETWAVLLSSGKIHFVPLLEFLYSKVRYRSTARRGFFLRPAIFDGPTVSSSQSVLIFQSGHDSVGFLRREDLQPSLTSLIAPGLTNAPARFINALAMIESVNHAALPWGRFVPQTLDFQEFSFCILLPKTLRERSKP